MKKALSFLLVLSMLIAMSSGTLAVDGSHSKEEIRVVDNTGRGQYTISKGVKALLGIDGGVAATATDIDDTIYYIEEQDRYLVEVFADNYLLTERIDITSPDELHNIGTDGRIAPETLTNLEDAFSQQRELGNDAFHVSAFVPALLENAVSGISTYADGTPDRSETYYTYNGYDMRDTNFKYWNSYITFEKSGSGTSSIAKAAKELVLSAFGFSDTPLTTPLSIFGLLKSAYDVYVEAHGGVSYGASGDNIRTIVVYDKIEKYTALALEPNAWIVGGISKKAWLNKQSTTQFYSANGALDNYESSINKVIESPRYTNAAAYVDKSGTLGKIFNDKITMQLYGITGIL